MFYITYFIVDINIYMLCRTYHIVGYSDIVNATENDS